MGSSYPKSYVFPRQRLTNYDNVCNGGYKLHFGSYRSNVYFVNN